MRDQFHKILLSKMICLANLAKDHYIQLMTFWLVPLTSYAEIVSAM